MLLMTMLNQQPKTFCACLRMQKSEINTFDASESAVVRCLRDRSPSTLLRREGSTMKSYYQSRLEDQVTTLKKEHGYLGVAFFVENSTDPTQEDIAKDATLMLDDLLSGDAPDITDSVL